jgi:hypothetical protein
MQLQLGIKIKAKLRKFDLVSPQQDGSSISLFSLMGIDAMTLYSEIK